ncbi:ABC transporter permease [Paracoccus zhejiangensis]|uniref:ABC transporter permease n=1 Tax=Paracoccus zhejiangensis TaxID=1077935 RepID=A0A2H5F1U2_9RHOB|nr:ABC transporter permease [Paracoccus zhejiangensis]AUH65521.1 ABC transporter permease [Paracoccus zhejiangensis]
MMGRYALVQRSEVSLKSIMLVPLVTFVLALLGSMVLFGFLGAPPLEVLYRLLIDPLASAYNISEVVIKAAPLILIAQGLAIGFRAKVWNIGAEGQLIIGAVAASVIPITFPESQNVLMLPAMMLAGTIAGAAWAGIAAALKTRFNASEIIVTLMLNQIAVQILYFLISGPLKDPMGFSYPQSVSFPPVAMYPLLSDDGMLRASASILVVILLSIAALIYVTRTFSGYTLLVGGLAPSAASYAGFSAKKAVWITLLIGGAAAGLAGVGEISGPIGRLQPSLSPGYGFAAIIVAYLGGLHPVGILLAGTFMAIVYVGADGAIIDVGLPSAAPVIFQGMVLVFYLASFALVQYRIVRIHQEARA